MICDVSICKRPAMKLLIKYASKVKFLTVGTDTKSAKSPKVRSSKYPEMFLGFFGSPLVNNRRQIRNPPLNRRRPVDENINPGRGQKV